MYHGTGAQQFEKSILLADRRTSSLGEEQLLGSLHENSNSSPPRPNVASEKASNGLLVDLQGTRLANRLKGLGLAGISSLFQAAMSVCKGLGYAGPPVATHRMCKMTCCSRHCTVGNLSLSLARFAQFFISVTVYLVSAYWCHCKALAVNHQVHLNQCRPIGHTSV